MRATPWLLLAPAIVVLLVLLALPYVAAVYYSFTDARLTTVARPDFVALDSYQAVASARLPAFATVLFTTFLFTAGTAVGALGLGTGLAIALHTLRPGLRAMCLATLLIPYVLAGVIVGYTWKLMYDPEVGLANAVLGVLGLPGIGWLSDRFLALAALVVTNVWAGSGVVLLVMSAALTNLPRSILLAAQVDGAGPLTTIRRVVLPNVRPTFLLAMLVAVVSGLNVFDLIFVLTGGGPVYGTETLALTMYRLTFRLGEVGPGSAVTTILLLVSVFIAVLYVVGWQREARRWR